jgi:hypothetical protein
VRRNTKHAMAFSFDEEPMSIYDLTVRSADGRRILAVTTTAGIGRDSEDIELARELMMSEEAGEKVPFFLLAERDRMFLWKKGAGPYSEAETAPVEGLLREYAPSVVEANLPIPKGSMDILIYAWLDDLARGIREPRPESEADELLVRAGVYDEIRGGRAFLEDKP